MEQLKLIAFDADDLAVISAHLQDAALTIGEMVYAPHQKRFAALVARCNWTLTDDGCRKGSSQYPAALRLERVLSASTSGIDLSNKAEALSLLAIQFSPKAADDPEGYVTLLFANGSAIRLHVECIEAELRDLEPSHQGQKLGAQT
jgi:hypothetical protein